MPKGQYQRFKKVGATPAAPSEPPADDSVAMNADGTPVASRWIDSRTSPFDPHDPDDLPTPQALPRGWAKGAHLNVRNTGAEYRITLFPEEFDPLQPERCLRFTNTAECQNFVSRWYSRESHDPRAR